MIEHKKHAAFETIEAGLARKGNGSRIYARVAVGKRWTWRTTRTDDLVLAKKWKDKWDQKQWLERQGYVVKEPHQQSGAKGPDGANNSSGQDAPEKGVAKEATLTVNELFDKYVAAGPAHRY